MTHNISGGLNKKENQFTVLYYIAVLVSILKSVALFLLSHIHNSSLYTFWLNTLYFFTNPLSFVIFCCLRIALNSGFCWGKIHHSLIFCIKLGWFLMHLISFELISSYKIIQFCIWCKDQVFVLHTLFLQTALAIIVCRPLDIGFKSLEFESYSLCIRCSV